MSRPLYEEILNETYPEMVSRYVTKALMELAERLETSGRVAVSDPYWVTDEEGAMRLTVDTMPKDPTP